MPPVVAAVITVAGGVYLAGEQKKAIKEAEETVATREEAARVREEEQRVQFQEEAAAAQVEAREAFGVPAEGLGPPEAMEESIYEEFMTRERPRMEAEMAQRGLTRSSEWERGMAELQTRGTTYARDAALRQWQAQVGAVQRQEQMGVEAAWRQPRERYETAVLPTPTPSPEEVAWGGIIGETGRLISGWGEGAAPVVTGPTPGAIQPAPTYQDWEFAWA